MHTITKPRSRFKKLGFNDQYDSVKELANLAINQTRLAQAFVTNEIVFNNGSETFGIGNGPQLSFETELSL